MSVGLPSTSAGLFCLIVAVTDFATGREFVVHDLAMAAGAFTASLLWVSSIALWRFVHGARA